MTACFTSFITNLFTSYGLVSRPESSCHVERLMMVRFLSQDGTAGGDMRFSELDPWKQRLGLKV